MSAAAQTKIFGLRVGVDPKILIVGLFVLVGLVYWYNSRSDESETPAASGSRSTGVLPSTSDIPARARRVVRRQAAAADARTLRFRAVDATRGDIDPTLRVDLLSRLQSVPMPEAGRNLFEFGAAPAAAAALDPIHGPKIVPRPLPPQNPTGTQAGSNEPPPLNIPLKYYGFVKAAGKNAINHGFFLDGDNVLVASEGEAVKQHYLIVELTANTAKIEDTQVKRSETLQVVPAALPQP